MEDIELTTISQRELEVKINSNEIKDRKELEEYCEEIYIDMKKLREKFKQNTLNDKTLVEYFKNDTPKERFSSIMVAGSVLGGIQLRNIWRENNNLDGEKEVFPYGEIRRFLRKNEFEHRQGSGYVSKDSLNDGKIFAIIQNMSMELDWLRSCVKQIDVTNIGKQHSLIDAVSKAPINNEIDELEI